MVMRLRVLELPTVVVGEMVETPFVFLLDRVASRESDEPLELDQASMVGVGRSSGVLVFDDEVDLA